MRASREYNGFPIWVSALIASDCKASRPGGYGPVHWEYRAGKALYTNRTPTTSRIEPLGVELKSGYTLSVTWMPDATAYTLDIFRQHGHYRELGVPRRSRLA